jgi:hypothetical protein
MKCPSCQSEKVLSVDVNIDGFNLCSNCAMSFLPKDKMLQLDRKLFSITKKQWRQKLLSIDPPQTPTHCLNHPEQALQEEKVPGYAHTCHISPCCETLHLTPSNLAQVFEVTENVNAEFKASYKVKSSWNPLKGLMTAIFGSKNKTDAVDDIEALQYTRKIEPLYKEA